LAIAAGTGDRSALYAFEQKILGLNRSELKNDWQRENWDRLKVQGFAKGGTFGGGIRMVGEQGPEIEFTGPAHIANGASTANFFATQEAMLAELRGLRQDNRDLQNRIDRLEAHARETNINTGRTARVHADWDHNGTPEVRSA
jgi:hypothetical protein